MKIKGLKTDEEFKSTLRQVLDELESTIINELDTKQGKILTYWLNDWNELFLKKEKQFNPKELLKYKRGNIVKAHLGYNIGSEQGGLHYGIVMDINNSKTSNILTIIPLRSLEENESEESIDKRFEVFLGKALLTDKIKYTEGKIRDINRKLEGMKKGTSEYNKTIRQKNNNIRELKNLNKGSVAIVSQIRTISKMRVYEPLQSYHSLSKFVLDDDNMKEIEKLISKLYIKSVDQIES